MLLWASAVAASLAWNWHKVNQGAMEQARVAAQSSFDRDLVYRRWSAMKGGIYVPLSADTPPNPYLAFLPDRDVTTTDGKRLTLVNPAYMTRQVHELAAAEYGVRSHITSRIPLRPENAPDAWETRALLAFEAGVAEVATLEALDGEPHLRYMRPLITEEPCLKCHAAQGYRVGDIRGGISVAVPWTPFLEIARRQHLALLSGHLGIGLLGLAGLWLGGNRLRRSEERNELLLSSLGEGVYGVDKSGRCIFINPAALAMLELDEAAVIGHDQHALFHYRRPDDSPYPQAECPIHLTLMDGRRRDVEESFLRGDRFFPVQLTVAPLHQNGVITGAVVVFQDISERKEAERRFRQLAYYDTLTELPNRRLLLDRFDHAVAQAQRFQRALAILFLDLDRFKQINDTLGHEAGDLLLRQIAKRLVACVRAGDTVARTGGDEFVILLTEIARPESAAQVAEKVIAAFREPFHIQGRTVSITTSIGIAVYPAASTDDIQTLMKKADQAMYAAKDAGRNNYRFFKIGDG